MSRRILSIVGCLTVAFGALVTACSEGSVSPIAAVAPPQSIREDFASDGSVTRSSTVQLTPGSLKAIPATVVLNGETISRADFDRNVRVESTPNGTRLSYHGKVFAEISYSGTTRQMVLYGNGRALSRVTTTNIPQQSETPTMASMQEASPCWWLAAIAAGACVGMMAGCANPETILLCPELIVAYDDAVANWLAHCPS